MNKSKEKIKQKQIRKMKNSYKQTNNIKKNYNG